MTKAHAEDNVAAERDWELPRIDAYSWIHGDRSIDNWTCYGEATVRGLQHASCHVCVGANESTFAICFEDGSEEEVFRVPYGGEAGRDAVFAAAGMLVRALTGEIGASSVAPTSRDRWWDRPSREMREIEGVTVVQETVTNDAVWRCELHFDALRPDRWFALSVTHEHDAYRLTISADADEPCTEWIISAHDFSDVGELWRAARGFLENWSFQLKILAERSAKSLPRAGNGA